MEHFIFILMITGISASLSTNITLRMKPLDLTVRKCDKEGLMCKDCHTLVYCQKKDFDFIPIIVSQCGNDSPCDETKKACTVGGACRYKEFECPYNLPKPQLLPDPYSCRQYWWCNNGVPTPKTCDIPSSYNPISTECDILMQDSQFCLQGPIPPCQNNGQRLNMIGTPFIYECIKSLPQQNFPTIYPYLLLDSINPTDSLDPNNITTYPLPTTAADPSTSTTQDPYPCNYAGYFPYPPDCTQFFKCVKNPDGSFTKTMMKCRVGAYFNAYSQQCVRGTCTNPYR